MQIKVDSSRLCWLLECLQDMKASKSYYLTVGAVRFHLHNLSSVIDIVESNSVGFVNGNINPLNLDLKNESNS